MQYQAIDLEKAQKLTRLERAEVLAKRGAVVLTVGAMSVPAFAADDWSATIVQTINGAVSTISAIGLAVLTLYVTAKVFKWVKTAM